MSIMEDVLMANDRVDLVFSYSADGGLGSYDAIQAAEEKMKCRSLDLTRQTKNSR